MTELVDRKNSVTNWGKYGMFATWEHADEPICLNCSYWQFEYHEADSRSVGNCRRLSGTDWRYDVIPLGPKEALSLNTRCDFGCNQFVRKQKT